MLTKEEIKRKIVEGNFLSKLSIDGDEECWPYMGARTSDGYGSFHVDLKIINAHRFAYILFVGPIPKDLFVLHKCDNPPCCNPKHLFLGTNKDNILDAAKKGRLIYPSLKGEFHPGAKLTDGIVIEIRNSYDGSIEHREILAEKFGVKPKHILAIFMGQKRKDPAYQPDLTRLKNWVPRVNRGEMSHWAKLTNKQIEIIRQEYDGTAGCFARLGRKYGVRGHHIARIVRRERRRSG